MDQSIQSTKNDLNIPISFNTRLISDLLTNKDFPIVANISEKQEILLQIENFKNLQLDYINNQLDYFF